MKRLSLLVLLVIAMTVALTACFGTATPADTHVHTYTDDWCVDATNHWHAADCEHKDETIVKTAHDFVDGKCSVCGYYSYYTVTVNAPAGVTVAGDLTTKNGADVTFTATAAEAFVLTATGAEQVGEATVADGKVTYTYKVAAVKSADVAVEITAKQVKLATVVAEGTAQFDSFTMYDFSTTDITFTVPAAGTYLVTVFSEDLEGITFNDGDEVALVYAAEAGEQTVTTRYFSEQTSDEPVSFNYTVVAYEELFNLPAMSGEGYVLPANVPVTVVLTVPTPGMYQFATDGEYLYNSDAYGSTHYFMTTRYNETVTFTVELYDAAEALFTLNWEVSEVTFEALEFGETDIALPYGEYVPFSFTAPADGEYQFLVSDMVGIFYYNEYYGSLLTFYEDFISISEGETFEFFLLSYADTVDTLEDSVIIKNAPRLVDTWDSVAAASATGAENVIAFQEYLDGATWIITAPAGTTMSFDFGETWVSEYELTFALEDVIFLVKNETETDVELVIVDANDSGNGDGGDGGDIVGDIVELVLGENQVAVYVNENQYPLPTFVSFTATEAGTYTLSPADGEQNYDIYYEAEWISEFPFTFTLEAGETIFFDVRSLEVVTITEDVIDLVITKAE